MSKKNRYDDDKTFDSEQICIIYLAFDKHIKMFWCTITMKLREVVQ